MAVVNNTQLTYGTVGTREDLTDVIYNITPEETVFISSIGTSKAKQTFHEWQVDELAAPDTSNAHLEGDEAAVEATDQPTRLGSYVQISRKVLAISGTTEETDKAGRKSEMAYQAAKKGVEIRRDMEAIVLVNQAANAGGTGTARKTGSLLAWLKTNTDHAGDGADPVYTNIPTGQRTDGTLRDITEDMLKSVIQKQWLAGGKVSKLFVGAGIKQKVSAFTGIAQKTVEVTGRKQAVIVGAADVYVSDFGNVTVIPNRLQRNRDALLVDDTYISIMYLRRFKTEKLAKTGDSEKRMLIVEWGLKVGNEAAHGGIFDVK